jgi:predicted MFS family arabinose efflux permease
MVVGGGVLLAVHDDLGHHEMFAVMAALTALASVPVVLAREPATITSTAPGQMPPAGKLPHFLALPGAWRLIGLVAVYKLGESSAQGMLRPFLVDRGLGLADIAKLVGTVGFVAGMAGALVGGLLVGRLGRRRALIAFGFGQVIAVGGYAYLALGTPSSSELYAWAGVEHFASGMATAALFTAMMDWSRPAVSGTDYTVMASAVVIATSLGTMLGGASADAIGYGPHFAVAMGLCLVAVAIVARLFPRMPAPPVLPTATLWAPR